jgi:hypothetical protein
MSCKNQLASSYCGQLGVSISCLETIYQDENKSIVLQLLNADGTLLDINSVNSIQIILFDTREMPIAKYYYPEYIDPTTYTSGEEPEIDPYKDPWVDGLRIEILQTDIIDTNITYEEPIILNKGKISFEITKEVSNYLMSGSVLVDIKIVLNNLEVIIIKCFQIGKIEKNKFVI